MGKNWGRDGKIVAPSVSWKKGESLCLLFKSWMGDKFDNKNDDYIQLYSEAS